MGFPQELDEDITLEKKWLMILPASQEKYGPVADKVTSIIADAATSVGRFKVIDRNLVDEILEEQAFLTVPFQKDLPLFLLKNFQDFLFF